MDQSANNKKLLSFLVYSYFGFDISDPAEDKKLKCARRAYLDSARTIKYQYSSSELDKAKKGSKLYEYKNERNAKIFDVCKKLIESIEKCPDGNANFDSWHQKECERIQYIMNGVVKDEKLLKKKFTFGQAQKWVNMTLKYLWLLDMLPKGISAEDLHVPIDSFILEALTNICKDGTYKYNGEAWSRLTTDKYDTIQKEIRNIAKEKEINAPIEWENTAWIDVAKTRNSH